MKSTSASELPVSDDSCKEAAASPSSSPPEDLQPWKNFRAGNRQAFVLLYYQHIDALYHYGERLSPDKALIEDCLQDLFAELWTRQAQLPEVTTVKFYLFKALKRKIVKKQGQRPSLLSSSEPEGYDFKIVFPPEFELATYDVPHHQHPELLSAINQLTPRQKEAITLRFYDNFSYDEIAEIMSLSSRSVYNLTYRALAVLRRVLASTQSDGALSDR